jgi:hypothetical protein
MMRWAAYWTACGAAYQPKLRKYAVVDGIMCRILGWQRIVFIAYIVLNILFAGQHDG